MHATISIPDPYRGDLLDALAQRRLVFGPAAVAIARAQVAHDLTGTPFAHPKADPQKLHACTFLGRLYSFFRSTSCSMCLSNVRSATSCLSWRFSSSSCRN